MVKMQSSEITVRVGSPDPPLSLGLGRSAVRHGPTTLQEHNSGQGSGDGNDLYDDFVIIQPSCRFHYCDDLKIQGNGPTRA